MKSVRLILIASLALVGIAAIGIVAAQDSNTANVEVRVWQSTSDAESLYISARPEGGSWRTLGTIPLDMSGLNSRETFRYGDIALAVPLPEPVVPELPEPSDTQPVIHNNEGWWIEPEGGSIRWIAWRMADDSVYTAVESWHGIEGNRSTLRINCIQGSLSVTLTLSDRMLVRDPSNSHRGPNPWRGEVYFYVGGNDSRSQRWQIDSRYDGNNMVLSSYRPDSFVSELRGDHQSIIFQGTQFTRSDRSTATPVIAFSVKPRFGYGLLKNPVAWNIENCGRY